MQKKFYIVVLVLLSMVFSFTQTSYAQTPSNTTLTSYTAQGKELAAYKETLEAWETFKTVVYTVMPLVPVPL